MFIKHFLNHSSPTALMLFDGAEGGSDKSDVQLAREAIAANMTSQTAPKVEAEVEADAGAGEEESEEEADENEENDEEVEDETEEQKTARLAKEAQETADQKEKRRQDRVQKRIDKAVAGEKAAKAETEELRKQLAAKPDAEKNLTEEEVERRATAKAEALRVQEQFDAACEKLAEDGKKIDKDFDKKVQAMAEVNGKIPSRMIGILEDLPNGGEVLAFLANDEDEAEAIYEIANKPEKMAIRLVKLSDKLIEAKRKKPKEISKVPAPNETIGGNGRIVNNQITAKDTSPEGMESFIKKRNAQVEARRKERGY